MKEKEKTKFSEKTSPMMFNHIAKTYDKLNHVMTLGLDKKWRKAMLSLMPTHVSHWLDAATGTGDQIYFFLKHNFKAKKITGIDLSEGMLEIGQNKLKAFDHVHLQKASITDIPFEDQSLCALTCSFGIRNADPFEKALQEFYRVLKNQGTLIILESSRPKNPLLRLGHRLYMNYMLPIYAKILGSDPKAYAYLAQTTAAFPCGEDFIAILKKIGFQDIKYFPKTFGSVTIYYAKKA